MTMAVTESPDIIVMDIDISGFSSWQAIQILKESSSTWQIPVIAMADPSVTGQRLLQKGFDTYERKPISARYIQKKIDILLNKLSANQTEPTQLSSNPSPFSSSSQDIHRVQLQTSVVYVDDSWEDCQTMADIVQGAGYTYANISDSLQVLPQLVEYNPQLIFVELTLPVVNGYELCAQIRRVTIFNDTPVVIVTGNERLTDRVRARMVGASGFLSKPLRAPRVLKVLNRYLSPYSSV